MELKVAESYGYKIKVIKAHMFSAKNIFNNYVDHFYELKKNAATPVEKKIAKMNLNSLYGMFGRKLNMLRSIICNKYEALDI